MKISPIHIILLFPIILSLGGCNGALEEENATLTKKVEELQKNEADLQKKADELTQQVEGLAPLQTQVEALTQERDGMKAEQEINTENMLENDIKMGEIQNELIDAKNKIDELEDKLAKAEATTTPTTATIPAPANPAAVFPPTAATPTPAPANPAAVFPPAAPTTNPVTIPTTPPAIPNGFNPLTTPPVAAAASLVISVQLQAQGQTYPLPSCDVYITQNAPSVSKWGLYLKNPQVSFNNLQEIQASLREAVIHKKIATNAQGQANVSDLESGTYYISCAHPVTASGVQWSVRHNIKPGQNVLVLTNNNRIVSPSP
ncbi:MAG: hypothetical protein HOK49_15405 [Opitutae bacterium]|nr:hypothetical protein [Opitutae bacterium]MBT5689826.1 hypothetical protein [Opitutae bacterium]MBT6463904.1 hypothetical protein [Opitutae bacterium]